MKTKTINISKGTPPRFKKKILFICKICSEVFQKHANNSDLSHCAGGHVRVSTYFCPFVRLSRISLSCSLLYDKPVIAVSPHWCLCLHGALSG